MADFVLAGTATALVTPFTPDASAIDWAAFERLVEAQLAAGVDLLVPCGTTGETPTLSDAEQRELIRRTVALAKGRARVMPGTGSNSTDKTIKDSRAAVEAGADAVMVVMPYYSKPSQAGMIRHIELVAAATSAPIVLYNIPGRSVVELSVESTLTLLDRCPSVVGVKDATGNVLHCQELLRRAGDRVSVMSGDDPLTVPMMSVGARGVISVTSNVMPGAIASLVRAAASGDWARARREHLALLPLHRALFAEPNPQPTKGVLAARGTMSASVRAPLIEASADTVQAALAAMQGVEARA
jgi:4-hydroxy-tetrahydrodipicolinate synthase